MLPYLSLPPKPSGRTLVPKETGATQPPEHWLEATLTGYPNQAYHVNHGLLSYSWGINR